MLTGQSSLCRETNELLTLILASWLAYHVTHMQVSTLPIACLPWFDSSRPTSHSSTLVLSTSVRSTLVLQRKRMLETHAK